MTLKKQSSVFPILKLPAEIRNGIYGYTVVSDTPISINRLYRLVIDRKKSHAGNNQLMNSSQLAIAFTCRQLYEEVVSIYYSKNCFKCWFFHETTNSDNEFIDDYMTAIGPKNSQTIQDLRISLGWHSYSDFLWFITGPESRGWNSVHGHDSSNTRARHEATLRP